MKSMVEYVHDQISLYDFDIAVDFTLGNGYDTLFLQDKAKKVYSFDIQKQAIDKMANKVEKHVHLICDSHANFDDYLESFDVGIFNLGYLPNSKHDITTMLESTSIAVTKAVEKMTTALFIVVYIGHVEGLKESKWIDEYVASLDNHFNVSSYKMLNKKNSPYVIEIERRGTVE